MVAMLVATLFEQITPQTALLIAFLTAFPPTMGVFVAIILSKRTNDGIHNLHLELNSRLDELLDSRTREADMQGARRGRQEAEDEHDKRLTRKEQANGAN